MRSVIGFHLGKASASVLTTWRGGYMLVYSLVFKYHSREAGQVEQVRWIEREPPNMHGDRLDTGLELDAEFEM